MTTLDEETTRGVAQLARESDLQHIRTLEFAAKLISPPPPASEQIHLDLSANVEVAPSNGGFATEGRFEVKAGSGPERKLFVELSVRIGAAYRYSESLPAQEVLEGFAKTNGLIHLWPYFRAYVQQSCGQLAIPPIIIPPFRIKAARTQR